MATRSDSPSVGRHENEHLRRFLAARDRDDAVEMRRWWEELVIDFKDRMDGLVYLSHQGRLDDDEHELAVAMSMAKFSRNLIETFEGVSMGQLVNASKKLAWGICIDVQRSAVRQHQHESQSLDVGWNTDPKDGPAPAWEADEAWGRFDRAQRSAEVRDFLDWALPQILPERRRVLELSFQGAEIAEICAELGVKRDNAYQLRSRGFKDLKKLKEQYDA